MSLMSYISDPVRRAALAAEIQTSPQYLWQMATHWRGKRPSPGMAQAIERATHGAVTRQDLRPDIWPADEQPTQPKAGKVTGGGDVA